MKPLPFTEFFERSRCILGEGAVIERLRRDSDFELNPHIVNSALFMIRTSVPQLPESFDNILTLVSKTIFPYSCPPQPGGPAWNGLNKRAMKKKM